MKPNTIILGLPSLGQFKDVNPYLGEQHNEASGAETAQIKCCRIQQNC